ncbi:MAG: type II toxin-antitoxin system PemK/MazF family toxin [Planctomycetes bacterium]|nr:type II toxin-antitoxin system PemK/MazF family toxin [Planctomycetota bacterium]
MIVSVRSLNRLLDTVVVAPTSASNVTQKQDRFTNVLLDLDPSTSTGISRECVLQLHLVYALSPERLGGPVGVIHPDAVLEAEFALANGVFGDPGAF